MPTLRESLDYLPVELRFGTSGRRGRVEDLSQLEIYSNVRGELDFLMQLPAAEGGIGPGETLYIGYDLRPSSTAIDPTQGRGALAQAVVAAAQDAGLEVVNLGVVPTPALAAVAWEANAASIMITGSHIPFDRNGYKLNTAKGELLKSHEAPIGDAVTRHRDHAYAEDSATSRFDAHGMLRDAPALPVQRQDLVDRYTQRYTDAFGADALAGRTLLFYEHSSAGRALIPHILRSLGATVLLRGRSEAFVPVDTESLQPDMIERMQGFADEVASSRERIDAVLSADGDGDRPLLMAVGQGGLRFVPGDLLGMLAADFLAPDAVVVPVSCNDAIDRGPLRPVLQPKTRIGSPFVIDGLSAAQQGGATRVCGWEPNGGFLLGSDFELKLGTLKALPTRDAVLPLIAALMLCKAKGISLDQALDRLPARFGATALLREFPRATGLDLVERITPRGCKGESDRQQVTDLLVPGVLADIRDVNCTDGVRTTSSAGEVVHLRPSGNADEFRIYAVADTPEAAKVLADRAAKRVAQLAS